MYGSTPEQSSGSKIGLARMRAGSCRGREVARERGVAGKMGSSELERRRLAALVGRDARGGGDSWELAKDVQEEISELKNPR
jgi:hypothetical protein